MIHNPYAPEPMPWIKGNLHAHTTNSDGARDPQAVIDEYAARGYGFLMISDHDFFTRPEGFDSRGIALIPGNEITANGPHILHVDARTQTPPSPDRQQVIDAVRAEGGFTVVAHPNWEDDFAHCPQASLEAWQGYTGVEIYNGVVRRLTGNPIATDRWDRLLGLGRRVWGFAHDDSHRPGDDEIAWNMVQCESSEPSAIVEALRTGRFYASTGVIIETIRVAGRTIDVRTANAQRIVAHTDFGRHATVADGPHITFTVPENPGYRYVRFTCWGAGEAMAWTQPLFVDGE